MCMALLSVTMHSSCAAQNNHVKKIHYIKRRFRILARWNILREGTGTNKGFKERRMVMISLMADPK